MKGSMRVEIGIETGREASMKALLAGRTAGSGTTIDIGRGTEKGREIETGTMRRGIDPSAVVSVEQRNGPLHPGGKLKDLLRLKRGLVRNLEKPETGTESVNATGIVRGRESVKGNVNVRDHQEMKGSGRATEIGSLIVLQDIKININ